MASASREELAQHLAGVSIDQLLAVMADKTLFEVASQYYNTAIAKIRSGSAASAGSGDAQAQEDRAKRPLNAFMAFRTYYLRLFPEYPQKVVSGFLTTLWNKDHDRNKWALIAKVYSFVRDNLGKKAVNLSAFLLVCCPVMKIMAPNEYLAALGWEVKTNSEGKWVAEQNEAALSQKNMGHLETTDYPTTEVELLSTLVNAGYLGEQGHKLVMQMGLSSNGIIMTSESNPVDFGVPTTADKAQFVKLVSRDPYQAAQEILGARYDHAYFTGTSIHCWEADDLANLPYLPIAIPRAEDPNWDYPFDAVPRHSVAFDANTPVENRIMDISSAWYPAEGLVRQVTELQRGKYRRSMLFK
ncbi:hypothetical protein FDECE_16834 [Fusarium decemcellulare]|nr:hypothetical protein FDECE_16834 [Fusarium decemcellulare]